MVHIRITIRQIIILFVLALIWQCRDPVSKNVVPEEPVKTVTEEPRLPKTLLDFAGLDAGNSPEAGYFDFKIVTPDSITRPSDIRSNLGLYKAITNGKESPDWPIFSFKNGDSLIILAGGKGYGGGIWAHLLIDNEARVIKKIRFGHKFETNGFGAGIVLPDFASQFANKPITSGTTPPFKLPENPEKKGQGLNTIDGISGATISSWAAVQMVNSAIARYYGSQQ